MIIDANLLGMAYEIFSPGTILTLDEFWRTSSNILDYFVVEEKVTIAYEEYTLDELIDFVNSCADSNNEGEDWNFKIIDGKIYEEISKHIYILKDWIPEVKDIIAEWEKED